MIIDPHMHIGDFPLFNVRLDGETAEDYLATNNIDTGIVFIRTMLSSGRRFSEARTCSVSTGPTPNQRNRWQKRRSTSAWRGSGG